MPIDRVAKGNETNVFFRRNVNIWLLENHKIRRIVRRKWFVNISRYCFLKLVSIGDS